MSKGGGVLVNVQDCGCFSIFRRADDVTRGQCPRGVLVNVFFPLQEILYPRLHIALLRNVFTSALPNLLYFRNLDQYIHDKVIGGITEGNCMCLVCSEKPGRWQ